MKNTRKNKDLFYELAACFIFLLLVLLTTWPAVFSMDKAVVGGNFAFGHIWNWDLIVQGLLSQGKLITYTLGQCYPEGGSLTSIGWSFLLPLILMRALSLGLLLSVNLLLLVHLWLGFYLAYRLGRLLTENRAASMVGAIAYGLCPYALSLIWNGQYPKLSHGFLPLLLIFLIKTVETKKIWPVAGFGLVFALLLASSPYNGIFGAMLVVGASLYFLIVRRREMLRVLGRLASAAVASLIASAPFLYYYVAMGGANPLHEPSNYPQMPHVPYDLEILQNATLFGWLLPGKEAIVHQTATQWHFLHVHYLGWFVVVAALLAFVPLRPSEKTAKPALGRGFFLLTGFFFFLLALGYELRLTPDDAGGTALPLFWLFGVMPSLEFTFTVPYRAAIGVSLCVAMLAALGLARVGARWTIRTRGLVAAAIGIGIVLETSFVSPVPYPLPVREMTTPQVYRDLAASPDGGAVLEVPNEMHEMGEGANFYYIYYQVIHRHPLVIGELPGLKYKTNFFDYLLETALLGASETEIRHADGLVLLPFRYLVLHESFIAPDRKERVRSLLDDTLVLEKQYPEDGVRLYRVPSCVDWTVDEVEESESVRFCLAPDLPGA